MCCYLPKDTLSVMRLAPLGFPPFRLVDAIDLFRIGLQRTLSLWSLAQLTTFKGFSSYKMLRLIVNIMVGDPSVFVKTTIWYSAKIRTVLYWVASLVHATQAHLFDHSAETHPEVKNLSIAIAFPRAPSNRSPQNALEMTCPILCQFEWNRNSLIYTDFGISIAIFAKNLSIGPDWWMHDKLGNCNGNRNAKLLPGSWLSDVSKKKPYLWTSLPDFILWLLTHKSLIGA